MLLVLRPHPSTGTSTEYEGLLTSCDTSTSTRTEYSVQPQESACPRVLTAGLQCISAESCSRNIGSEYGVHTAQSGTHRALHEHCISADEHGAEWAS